MEINKLKRQLAAALAMLFVATISLTTATYAWYESNNTAMATNASIQASTAYSLLISNDGTDFKTAIPMDTDQKELVPVSTLGTLETTAREHISSSDQSATELFDLLFVKSNSWEDNYVMDYTEIGKSSVVGQDKVYYFTDTIWLRSAQQENVYLEKGGTGIAWALFDTNTDTVKTDTTKFSFADFMKDSADDMVKTTATTSNAETYNRNVEKARAMLKTLRVGLVITHEENSNEVKDRVLIYQLDSNAIDENNSAVTTSGENGADGITRAAGVTIVENSYITGAESDTGYSGAKLADHVDNYDASTGVPLIDSCAIQGSETGLVSAGSVPPVIENITANHPYKLDVYIWMEGCDTDTVTANVDAFNQGIFTGLQLGFCLGTE